MRGVALPFIVIASVYSLLAQEPSAGPNLAGVYRLIAGETTLPGGLKNQGSPAGLALQPSAAQEMKGVDLKQDPGQNVRSGWPFSHDGVGAE